VYHETEVAIDEDFLLSMDYAPSKDFLALAAVWVEDEDENG
jgi:hypothetical protein